MLPSAIETTFQQDGYIITPDAVAPGDIDSLIEAIGPMAAALGGSRGGIRHLLRDAPAVQELARHLTVRAIAEAAVGPGAIAVRGILFDKTPGANWKVIWHQDLTIATQARADVDGFGPWTEKQGIPHVQPPVDLLREMVAVRVHLDDCTTENGPVRVILGSHRRGRLTAAETDQIRKEGPEVVCTVPRGGILAFHSLLLHASSQALLPQHRRVVHLEYVARRWANLPGGLAWHERY